MSSALMAAEFSAPAGALANLLPNRVRIRQSDRMNSHAPKPLSSYRKFREEKAAPFLPMSRAEMAALGWDECDVILVTGDQVANDVQGIRVLQEWYPSMAANKIGMYAWYQKQIAQAVKLGIGYARKQDDINLFLG